MKKQFLIYRETPTVEILASRDPVGYADELQNNSQTFTIPSFVNTLDLITNIISRFSLPADKTWECSLNNEIIAELKDHKIITKTEKIIYLRNNRIHFKSQ